MRILRLYCLLFFCIGNHFVVAQNRQPDSLRQKQLAYNKHMQEQSRAAGPVAPKQTPQPKPGKGVVIVMYDSKGNRIEAPKKDSAVNQNSTISRDKEGRKVTTTTITLPPVLNRKFSIDTLDLDSITLRAIKGKHRLQVWHKGHLLTSYKCVFGPNPMQVKKCEGDRCTPEGTFTIQQIKDHEKWDKFILIDYPNEESWRQFEENKRMKRIPANAHIGGLIGIHGIWKNGDNVIDMKHGWTDGCISLKNADVEELARLLKPGLTRITIVK